MNKKIFFTLFLLLGVVFSISAIQASDINASDLQTLNSDLDDVIQVDGGAQPLSNGTDAVEVTKNKTQLSSPTKSTYYKGSFNVMLKDSNSTALADKKVKFVIKNKSYTAKTNKNGVASVALKLKPGKYNALAFFAGDDAYEASNNLTTSFKVLSTISSSNIKNVKGDSKKFSAQFFKSSGKPLANKYIKFKLNSKTYKIKTNSKGIAALSLKKLKVGTYKIICYNKDGLTKAYKIQIYKRKASTKLTTKPYLFFPGDSKTIKVKLSTALNDDSNSGKRIFIRIGDNLYSKKTDGNGAVSFKLPASLEKGFYNVEFSYNGNKFFKKSNVNKYIIIYNDTSKTKLSVKSTTTIGYGAGTLLKVAYTAQGVPLVKKTVTFNVDGKTYTNTTDLKGMTAVPINLKIGDYTITFKTDDEPQISGTSASCAIKVVQRDPCRLTWKSGSSFKDSSQTFKVFVSDLKGKCISDGIVELTIGGESYNSTISSGGYAKFETAVAIGKYDVSFKFYGNNEFLPNSSSKSINVKLSKFGNGLNEKNTISYLGAYLKSSSHCKVGNAKIKALVKSLTKGLKDDVDKAKAIFNYVRDTLEYSLYYNTHYGAVKTLALKEGNCVDHAHLLISMYRTAGFKARYVHGNCMFSDGRYGHVWTQVLIGKTWVVGDAISYRNSLGKIANWDTSTYYIYSKYRSLPF